MITTTSSTSWIKCFTMNEIKTVGTEQDGVMHILSSANDTELALLHKKTRPIGRVMLPEDIFTILKTRMLITVNNPLQPGVGIAAPQVGISLRLIAVQRFDMNGKPFVFYINPKIISSSEEKESGSEGCLSVPGISGNVKRHIWIKIRYRDENFRLREETVEGFTAVIFQHEIDHLDGILFTDRIEERQ